MTKICASLEQRSCPHCEIQGMLDYYKEDIQTNCDLYFCKNCFSLTIWDGKRHEAIDGEAYPDRENKL